MILVFVSPRNAGLPYAAWLPEEKSRLVAVTQDGVDVGEGFLRVHSVPDYTDDAAVLATAREAVRRHGPRAVLAFAEVDVRRAAALRAEFGLPGLDTATADVYRDKVLMKERAGAAGLRVPAFAPVAGVADVVDFMARHPDRRVVVKPRDASGSTGVRVLDRPEQAAELAGAIAATPYEVEEFVEGALHHVDAFRIDGVPVATVPSRYADEGCLAHWADAPLTSRNLPAEDPLAERLRAETWRLAEALSSPPTLCLHAEFFVTPTGGIVLCEVAARIGGGPIPAMLRPVLGLDPRELWARVECGLPVDADLVRKHAESAPLAAFCGLPPSRGRVLEVPRQPPHAEQFTLRTRVGDTWEGERYAQRKSGDFLVTWVVTARDAETLEQRLAGTAEEVAHGLRWDRGQRPAEQPGPDRDGCTARLLPAGRRPGPEDFAALAGPDIVWEDARWWRFTEGTDLHETRYLEVRQGGRPVALAPLLVTRQAGGLLFYDPPRLAGTAGAMAEPEYLDPGQRERWEELCARLPEGRPAHYPSVALATFGNHHGVVHATGRTAAERAAVMAALPGLLAEAAGELGCRSAAVLYVGEPEAADVDRAATADGYHAALLGAEGVQHLPYSSWEEYMAALSSRRRTRLRKELKDYAAAGYRTVARTGPEAVDDEVIALQIAHRAKYGLPGGEERVRRDFEGIRRELGEDCLVLGTEYEGRLVGFVLYLRTAHALFARTAGFAPEAHGCYLTLTYHETARWAVGNGVRRVHYGLAAYEAKFARGCELRPRWGWFAFQGDQAGTYAELLDLQSRSIERHLDRVGAAAPLVPSRRPAAADSQEPTPGERPCD
ncbi:GNAT family N-acetyltransferase [Streptomyces qinglanensis]|uniref:GNAT family N-acetyltransferase n=1 Tax=Streptomyces qinglanensis TaxID=943816 RepID=UPI003D75F331